MMNQPQPQYGSSVPQQQQKGCLGRNWKWMLPVGCLGLILIVVAFVGGIFFVVMSAMKSSEVYQYALNKAKSDPTVVEELGKPIQDGWFVQGSINTSGSYGNARFQIPIKGPKKSGTIYVVASKDASANGINSWVYDMLEVDVEGRSERIELTEKRLPQTLEDGDSGETDTDEPPLLGANSATPPTSGAKTISVGALDDKAISKPEPTYPAIGKAVKATGKVVVRVVVDESGNVISASAVSGHPLLQNAAVQAARQAKFTPMKLGGIAVKVTGTLTYNFVLE
jgi:TonB family protein